MSQMIYPIVAFMLPLICMKSAIAQSIVPDQTLGAEQSQVGQALVYVAPDDDVTLANVILGGATRGKNLFHSFLRFNIEPGQYAYFVKSNNAIENIFARVTGGTRSQIFGTLGIASPAGVTPSSNLFLINPNGIVFGGDARLDINGSFFATTASGIKFSDRGMFSANRPEVVSSVLTVSPSAFLFGQAIPSNIVLNAGSQPQATSTLSVRIGQTLGLVGGEIEINGGQLTALGGRIEIAAVAGSGEVGLNADSSLSIPKLIERTDITLRGALANVRADNKGDLSIFARNINVLEQSRLVAGIALQSGSLGSQAGNIVLDATGTVRIDGASDVENNLRSGATGKAGNLDIKANSLEVTDNSSLSVSTFGTGDAGNLSITVDDRVMFDDRGFAFATVDRGGQGKGGQITISANSLSVTDGSEIIALTRGRGDAGNITVSVRDAIFVGSQGTDQPKSAISSTVEPAGRGNGGKINLSARLLSMNNGSQIVNSTFGNGNAGDIEIKVWDQVLLDGSNVDGFSTGIYSSIEPRSRGNGGNITLNVGSVRLTNGAQLSTSGNALGSGNAGNITIEARDSVVFDGISRNPVPGANGRIVVSSAGSRGAATGRGGDIRIKAGSLTFTNRGQVSSGTEGSGKGGDITFEVRDRIVFDGSNSGAESQTGSASSGDGGNIEIKADSLTVTNGAQVLTRTFGRGDAGNIEINVTNAVVFKGKGSDDFLSGASTGVSFLDGFFGEGDGGDLRITAGSLLIDKAILSASSRGFGNAGNIFIALRDALEVTQGEISTDSFITGGGEIELQARTIRLQNQSNILTKVEEGTGSGGDITLSADAIIALDDSNILAFAQNGRGGNITLNTRAFFGQNYRAESSGSDLSTLTENGRVDINASGSVSGVITLPDTTFIQNSLNSLSQSAIDTNTLLANSCIVRNQQNGSFYITGTGGLPINPGEISTYATGTVQPTWKLGDAIVEPQSIYQLPDGKLILSRECD